MTQKNLADVGSLLPERPGTAGDGTRASADRDLARAGKVRIHPIPDECPPDLASFIASCVRGAVRSALESHVKNLTKNQRGMLVGSIGKRAVNQLCCKEGRRILRELIDARGK